MAQHRGTSCPGAIRRRFRGASSQSCQSVATGKFSLGVRGWSTPRGKILPSRARAPALMRASQRVPVPRHHHADASKVNGAPSGRYVRELARDLLIASLLVVLPPYRQRTHAGRGRARGGGAAARGSVGDSRDAAPRCFRPPREMLLPIYRYYLVHTAI